MEFTCSNIFKFLQVVSEFRKHRQKRSSKKSIAAKQQWQELWLKRVQGTSKETKDELKKERRRSKKTRSTAYVYCRALDHQMAMAGIDMAVFWADKEEQATSFLRRGEKRYFVACGARDDDEGPVRRRRCVIKDQEGKKRYEVPRFANGLRPHLTLCGDQGGSGLPAWNFLFQRLRLRGSIYSDPFHRVARDWKLSLQHSGLWSYVQEGQVLLTWLHGPWKSEMWFSVIVDAMEEYVRECGDAEDLAGWGRINANIFLVLCVIIGNASTTTKQKLPVSNCHICRVGKR
jgi:hypothetical protein